MVTKRRSTFDIDVVSACATKDPPKAVADIDARGQSINHNLNLTNSIESTPTTAINQTVAHQNLTLLWTQHRVSQAITSVDPPELIALPS